MSTEQLAGCCDCRRPLKEHSKPKDKWFGKYRGDKLVKRICQECIRKPENEGWHKNDDPTKV